MKHVQNRNFYDLLEIKYTPKKILNFAKKYASNLQNAILVLSLTYELQVIYTIHASTTFFWVKEEFNFTCKTTLHIRVERNCILYFIEFNVLTVLV